MLKLIGIKGINLTQSEQEKVNNCDDSFLLNEIYDNIMETALSPNSDKEFVKTEKSDRSHVVL